MSEQYDSESGKDAWKAYRRIMEQADSPIQSMLHGFGEEQFVQGYAAGVQAARDAVDTWAGYTFPRHKPAWVNSIFAAIDGLRGDE